MKSDCINHGVAFVKESACKWLLNLKVADGERCLLCGCAAFQPFHKRTFALCEGLLQKYTVPAVTHRNSNGIRKEEKHKLCKIK